jgi:hypothetical protein
MKSPPPNPSSPSPFPFSPQEAMDFMQKMWNPLGVPIPGLNLPGTQGPGPAGGLPFPNPATMFATLDPAEVDRKIGELKIVEGWLTMSLSMMQMSIKTLELQKAALEALRAAQAPAAAASAPEGGSGSRRKS